MNKFCTGLTYEYDEKTNKWIDTYCLVPSLYEHRETNPTETPHLMWNENCTRCKNCSRRINPPLHEALMTEEDYKNMEKIIEQMKKVPYVDDSGEDRFKLPKTS
jgi:hypothetical protein